MKIMVKHDSARLRLETPHATNHNSDALKQRAQSVINNKSIDAGTRALIRYGLEINDPWLGDLVRRVDAGETIIDNRGRLQIE
jgi:alkyl hydroperoxide reductase subunit AhpF